MKRALPALLLSALSLSVFAQAPDKKPERWYEVEIIVFENLNVDADDSEYWPADVGKPDMDNAVELIVDPPQDSADQAVGEVEAPAITEEEDATAPLRPVPYKLLPADQYQLRDAFVRLANADDYLPLIHVAWRQIVPPRNTPDRIHLHSDLPLPFAESVEADVSRQEAETLLEPEHPTGYGDGLGLGHTVEPVIEEETPPKALDGIVSIGLARYLHVAADLLLYKPLPEEEIVPEETLSQPPEMLFFPAAIEALALPERGEKNTAEFFRIQGKLRMRSNEVHYLDHPRGGMLILFTRYEIPEPEVVEEELIDALPLTDDAVTQ